ncbi:Kelch repeat-containing protein-like protein 2 [Colletotrichum truncatum]|uniref:Kelch repeat-containing protein-like protein 2 n=1 Tax=Colletotrichum truncatum TaxID=5467 RepID=A0ACC3YZP1_COLTU|nr:Kelch repeat-containing protein-like protein 2 [Colletotrichum truncatum]KAF6786322.1 Kelch repeat-containing protein-like protein 2 [Colletotrichum truncatum]
MLQIPVHAHLPLGPRFLDLLTPNVLFNNQTANMRFIGIALLIGAVSMLTSASLIERQAASSTSVFVAPTSVPAPTVNSSVYDLSQHFCRIFRHASVYANGKIYIDGGNTYVPRGGNTFYNTPAGGHTGGMHSQLLVLDLSKNFTNQETGPYRSIFKAPDVPNGLIEHALWYSESTRKIYQLGGWFSFNNQENPSFLATNNIPEPAIWEFDIDTERWSKSTDFRISNNGEIVDRPGAAAFCDAPTLRRSYIFEGYTQQRSSRANVPYEASADFRFLEGMLELDTSDESQPKLTNISVPTYIGPRMNGAMVHVPVGNKGIIVNLGGQTTRDPTPYGVRVPKASSGNININLSFVDIYDIETGFWFRQETFGLPDIPTGRSDICAVLVPAKDSSSWNIYMIAGVENYATYITSEEIWVLSLPTFQWTMVHTRADGMYGHTCHAVGENLLIVGGIQTNKEPSRGNVNTCADHMPVEIFSLATHNYTGRYDTEAAKRIPPVPSKVVASVGGTSSGGAVLTKPRVWSDVYLQYIFDPSLPRPEYKPTYTLVVQPNSTTSSSPSPTPSSNGPSKGALIGGVVGGVLGAIAIVCLGIFIVLLRRKKKKRAEEAAAAAAAAAAASRHSAFSELPGYSPFPSPEPKPGFGGFPPAPPVTHAAELEVPRGASEMPSSPRYGGSVEMGSEVTQSPRVTSFTPTIDSDRNAYEERHFGHSPVSR